MSLLEFISGLGLTLVYIFMLYVMMCLPVLVRYRSSDRAKDQHGVRHPVIRDRTRRA